MNRIKVLNLTKEQAKIYNECHAKAVEYFKLPKGWVLHHIDPTMVINDLDRYIHWYIEDLQPMPKGEHFRIHNLGKEKSEETCKLLSKTVKASWDNDPERKKELSRRVSGENNPMYGSGKFGNKEHPDTKGEKNGMYGKKHTEESKRKMSEAQKNREYKPFTETHKQNLSKALKGRTGIKSVSGKKVYNNGLINKYFIPGLEEPGFVMGSLRKGA